MPKLGISIYPSKSSFNEMKNYLDRASALGYRRIFTSMLEVRDSIDETITNFKDIIQYGNTLGFETSIDVNPAVLHEIGINPQDLGFFHDLGVTAVRLDEGFTGHEEALMTQNPYNIKIEINISRGQHYIDMIMDFGANRNNLTGCHNFYPQPYSGLGNDYLLATSAQYKKYQLTTAAFVDTPSGSVGPWPFADLMVTAECERTMDFATQVRFLKATNLIDDIIISSSLVNDKDLKLASEVFNEPTMTLPIIINNSISDLERTIAFEELHQYRGDFSDYMIRSSQPRVKYRNQSIPPKEGPTTFKRGDVIIGNDNFGQYKGELQIVLQPFDNHANYNLIGHVDSTADILIKFLHPWHNFKLRQQD
ncbi:DUF871 domain-containing protein [Periweissella fabalis]|uniref:DUF871 domain-containing protein n=1 Tax=Periweissella fabalis TaxID=1070421 RepID=A0A7X6N3Z1_9LACO|nr:MupG family TIM beta-alpha barrel fold protein [Periweissella fabalis]MCM0599678.1 DUF871 domain-containing protein [Periweissella fabalis]NKZ24909.1 DUF871 domain-containing protein [Periweissella fabalis]